MLNQLERYHSFEIHLKRLDEMKRDLEEKKKKKFQMIDAKQNELLKRTNKNKRHAHIFQEQQRMLEIQRTNESLIRRIEDISQRSNTQQIKTLLNQRSQSIEVIENNLATLDDTKSLIKDQSKLSISFLQPKLKKFSLIESRRKREEKQIHDENKKMMMRILSKTPSVSLKQQQKDYQRHKAAKKVLQQYHEDYFPVEQLQVIQSKNWVYRYQKRKMSVARLPPLISEQKRSILQQYQGMNDMGNDSNNSKVNKSALNHYQSNTIDYSYISPELMIMDNNGMQLSSSISVQQYKSIHSPPPKIIIREPQSSKIISKPQSSAKSLKNIIDNAQQSFILDDEREVYGNIVVVQDTQDTNNIDNIQNSINDYNSFQTASQVMPIQSTQGGQVKTLKHQLINNKSSQKQQSTRNLNQQQHPQIQQDKSEGKINIEIESSNQNSIKSSPKFNQQIQSPALSNQNDLQQTKQVNNLKEQEKVDLQIPDLQQADITLSRNILIDNKTSSNIVDKEVSLIKATQFQTEQQTSSQDIVQQNSSCSIVKLESATQTNGNSNGDQKQDYIKSQDVNMFDQNSSQDYEEDFE